MIDIVLTTWRRESITLLVLETLRENTKTPYNLIIMDNGSDPVAKILYKKYANVYHEYDHNVGLEQAKHDAMQYVESEVFISTDNDVIVPHGWDEDLINLYNKYPEYKAIALRPQVLVGTGDIFGANPPEVLEFSHVPGYMRIMDTQLVKDLGAWKDKRELRGHEEYWISERIRNAGYKVGWASNIPCMLLFGQDGNWGYGDNMTPEESGHNPVAGLPRDNYKEIERFING